MSGAISLLPCPFCGGPAKHTGGNGLNDVRCGSLNGGCPVQPETRYHATKAAAAKAWNRRAEAGR